MSRVSKQCAKLVAGYQATGKPEQKEFGRKVSEIEAEVRSKTQRPLQLKAKGEEVEDEPRR